MKSVIITQAALETACHPEFPVSEILSERFPAIFGNTVIRAGKNSILIATATCGADSRMLVIGKGAFERFELLDKDDHSSFFDRCVRFGLRSFDKRIALSPKAMPYREGSRSSVFACSGSTLRILVEENFSSTGSVYVYDMDEAASTQRLADRDPDPTHFNTAMAEVPSLLERAIKPTPSDKNSIDFDWQATGQIAKGFAYAEWLPILSTEQRDFVERKIEGPLRVRGAAGTGKTLAMVMKALTVAKDAGDNPARILFLTHSWAMASQVDEMILSIGRDIPAASLIEVYPLLEMARQRDYSLVGREPMGLDSEAGILKALDVIGEILQKFIAGDWIAYRSACSPEFVARVESSVHGRERRNLAWDLLSEFGCVLAADGLLARAVDRERYHRIRRVGYMMLLSNATERDVAFDLWVAFLAYLKDEGYIATDQIVSDYLSDLRTFYWEAKRHKDGYDYVFVDEMHLFNAQERLVFHNLLADGNITPNVVMALDPKQSPREVFTEIADQRDHKNRSIYERAQLPNPVKVDFVDIYRYTKEITQLTRSIIDAVPGLDMNEDWDLPGGSSVSGNGPKPIYHVAMDLDATFKTAISMAKSYQMEARSKGGQVAILCMDYDRFGRLHRAAQGQNPKDIFVISSRDDVERLRFMKQRIVFSTPEYVAGLQFDTVVLIDANANLVPDGAYRGTAERRFLSELYLGMSRAERRLIIMASKDCDGLTPYLATQVAQGLLTPLD